MRSIAQFINLRGRVEWASKMLDCYESLEDAMKEAYAFLLPYRELVEKPNVCVDAIRHVEQICKKEGLGKRTYALCKGYIIRHVIGNANSRRTRLGMEMIKYFDKQCELLKEDKDVHQISSDIIESDFGTYETKKSPNKLYGITSLVLMLPLYPKVADYSGADKQDFKVHFTNVKLKEIHSPDAKPFPHVLANTHRLGASHTDDVLPLKFLCS